MGTGTEEVWKRLLQLNSQLKTQFQVWDGEGIYDLKHSDKDSFDVVYDKIPLKDRTGMAGLVDKYLGVMNNPHKAIEIDILDIQSDTDTFYNNCCIDFTLLDIKGASDFIPTYGRIKNMDFTVMHPMRLEPTISRNLECKESDEVNDWVNVYKSDPDKDIRIVKVRMNWTGNGYVDVYGPPSYVKNDGSFTIKGISRSQGAVKSALKKFKDRLINDWILLEKKYTGFYNPGVAVCMPVYYGIQNILYKASYAVVRDKNEKIREANEADLKRLPGKRILIET